MVIRTTLDLAHLVRDSRSRLGLTQAALAERAGVSRKWVVSLETGKRTADVSLVLRTIKALGLDMDIRSSGTREMDLDTEVDQVVERSKRRSR
jgi:y4mF family transcriptional regulator